MNLVHIYVHTMTDEDTLRRCSFAASTFPEWSRGPVSVFPRVFDGDGFRKLVYVKDLINGGLVNAPENCGIFLTNSDTCLGPNVELFDDALAFHHRREFHHRLDAPLTQETIDMGESYPGIDAFCFPRRWWNLVCDQYPDMLYGPEAWDLCMRELMYRNRGDMRVLEFDNQIYHESHESAWRQPENIRSLPSQLWNVGLAREFVRGNPELEAILNLG